MNNIIYVNSQAEAAAKGYKFYFNTGKGKQYWFPDRKNYGLFIREQNPDIWKYSDKGIFANKVAGCGAYFEKIYAIILREHPELLENLVDEVYDIYMMDY